MSRIHSAGVEARGRFASSHRVAVGLLSLSLSLVFVPACGGGGGGGRGGADGLFTLGISPVTPFRFPAALDPEFTGNNVITVTFSKAVDRGTILDAGQPGGTTSSFRLIDSQGQRVLGKAFVGGRDADGMPPAGGNAEVANDDETVVRFIADTDEDLSTPESFSASQVTLRIRSSIRSRDGDFLARETCATYLVGMTTMNPPPRVVTTIPVANASEVELRQSIIVEFSEEMDPLSVVGGASATQPPGISIGGFNVPSGIQLPSTFFPGRVVQTNRGDNCSWSFIPDGPFPGDTVITVRVQGPAGGGVVGVTDALGAPLDGGSLIYSFTTRSGPTVANNPVPPHTVYFGAVQPDRFGVIGANNVTDSTGNPFLIVDSNGDGVPTREDDLVVVPVSENSSIGTPLDIQVGDIVTPGNQLDIPPFPNPPPPQPLASTATAVASVCVIPPVFIPNSTNADMGYNIYVVDGPNNVVHVINGQTSLEVATIQTPDPTRLAVDPDFKQLFVTNFSANTVSVVDIDRTSPRRYQIIRTMATGLGPEAITLTPHKEDLLVVNRIENTVSIFSYGSLTLRKTISTLIGPEATDISSTYRMLPFPFGTGTYFAFITNRGGNNVAIFESGPSQPTFLGPDDINIVLTEGPNGPLQAPIAVADDRTFNPGCYFVTNENRSVGHVSLTFFGPPPLPNFPNPGSLREFKIIAQSDPNDPFKPVGVSPVDICLGDNVFLCSGLPASIANSKAATTSGLHGTVRRIFVANAGEGTVSVIDATNLLPIARVPVPGVRVIRTYYP